MGQFLDHLTVLGAALLMVACLSSPTVAQPDPCVDSCGDVNGNDSIAVSDLDFLRDYLYLDGPEPPCYQQAEWDNHQLVDLSDFKFLAGALLQGYIPDPELFLGTCPPAFTPLAPPISPHNGIRLPERSGIGARSTVAIIPLTIAVRDTLEAFCLPLRFHLPDDTLIYDTVVLNSQVTGYFNGGVFISHDDSGGVCISGVRIGVPGGLPPGIWEAGYIRFSVPEESWETRYLDPPHWTTFPPAYDGQNVHRPLFIYDGKYPETHTTPAFPVACCNQFGDATGNWRTDVSDINALVAFLFGSQHTVPYCPTALDVNSNGLAEVSDLTYLVRFLFRGGSSPAPCP